MLIANAVGLVLVHHDSQKIKKAIKIYLASGNKVLDIFSAIQYETISCLHIINAFCNLIGTLNFESDFVPSAKNGQNTRPS